ncbi:DUF3040 domain-containing protein [Streptomyces sp. NPDC088337]|uniref:DUF3040 domain-containing protein n=1 Tax=unclassified Streptomyces TaxID=2593676 RepID=UPI000C271E37|nr:MULTISPECIES: DUF3040 domain-containing protein [unclassified Streptomyces]PJM97469.1 hypothetical protein CG719_00725 [Streptomyces sp. CB01373]WSB29499.1 DUF3040 domain-containing protein [Streptomyces sp. NBC_01788]
MSTGRLPDREQRILNEIERALSRDRRLVRRLRSGRKRPVLCRVASYAPPLWAVMLLTAVSLALLTAGAVSSEPGVIWAFAAVWPVTLFCALRLLCRRAES